MAFIRKGMKTFDMISLRDITEERLRKKNWKHGKFPTAIGRPRESKDGIANTAGSEDCEDISKVFHNGYI